MLPKALVLTCTEEDRTTLGRWIRSRTIEARLVELAKIITKCIQGQSVLQIAKDLKIRPNTVIDWRRRFQQGGRAGLHDLPRPGKPPIYGQEFRNKVLETLEQTPPAGQAVWDGPAVAEQTGASVHAV